MASIADTPTAELEQELRRERGLDEMLRIRRDAIAAMEVVVREQRAAMALRLADRRARLDAIERELDRRTEQPQ